jgi:hypothetical protein
MDQNTTSNNIEVLRNILREQCELQDNFFDQKPAILVGGDNKTLVLGYTNGKKSIARVKTRV